MYDVNGVELQKGDKVAFYGTTTEASGFIVGTVSSITFYGVLIEYKRENGYTQIIGMPHQEVVKVWDNTKYEKLCTAILKYQEESEDEDLLNRILSYIED